ncbi:hypothetical protein [Paenibacillus odorifer]|uniref:hypothetical protein n=1 Tax=Paenibacillus odorifer TaxID=189426 RepID=UPI00117DA2C4|nr:hypothetical protein [Paenibacillus odorifer]
MGKHFNVQPKYMGVPSFTYEFETSNGIYVVDQAGKITKPEGNEVELISLLNGSPIEGVSDHSALSAPADTADPDTPDDRSESEDPNDPVTSNEPEAPAAPADQEVSVDANTPFDPAQSIDVNPAEAAGSAESKSSAELAASSNQVEPNITDLEIAVPMGEHTGHTLRNLANLIYSRQALMVKALDYDGNIIEDAFITAIHDPTIDTSEKLMAKISEVSNFCPGIAFDFYNKKLTFKFFQGRPSAEKIQAYTQLVELLNQTAQTLKYASTKSKETDNDKFTFRLFLIRLGMVGVEYKLARKILLDKLEGNSAFRNGSKPDKAASEEPAESVS